MSGLNGEQPAAVQPIPPSEVPSVWGYGNVPMADGTQRIVVQIQTPTGVFVDFISPDAALQIGKELLRLGRNARTGLILPPGIN